VQRRRWQGGEQGAPAARSVETAETRVSRQQRRGRAGGIDEDVRSDDEICRGGQTLSWPAAGVNLSVEIEVPGSWFDGTEMGSLSASERRQKYKAQAVEYTEVREFPGASARARKVKEPAIRFICLDDASSDPNSDGYWMQLSQWNRFRHDTFKERPDDEMPFILGTGPSSVLAAELDSGGATAKPVHASGRSRRVSFLFTTRSGWRRWGALR